MARTTATNFSGGVQFPYATAATDLFKKEDVQVLAQAVDQHDHTTGKGLILPPGAMADGSIVGAKLADGTITSAKIADGTIALVDLAPDSVDSSKIVNGSIATTDLAAGACTGAALGADVVKTSDPMFAAWSDWTTAVIQQGGATVTYTSSQSRYKQIGKVAHVEFQFAITGTGAAGVAVAVSTVPIAPRFGSGYNAIGDFICLHGGVFRSGVVVLANSTSVLSFLIDNNGNFMGLSPSFALASGDVLAAKLAYEAA